MQLLRSPLLGVGRVGYRFLSSLPLLIQAVLHGDSDRISTVLRAYRLLASALANFLMAFGYGLLSAGFFLLAVSLPALVILVVVGVGLSLVGLLDPVVVLGVNVLSGGVDLLGWGLGLALRGLRTIVVVGIPLYLGIVVMIVLYREGKHVVSQRGDSGSAQGSTGRRNSSRNRGSNSTGRTPSKSRTRSTQSAPSISDVGSADSIPALDVDYHNIEYDEHGQLVH